MFKMKMLLLLTLFTTVGGYARLRLCPGDFGVEGEWIYFLPSVDHPFYALEGSLVRGQLTNITTEKLLDNPFEFSSGYRVGGGFAFCTCDLDIQLHWTHLRTGNREETSGDPLVVTLSDSGILTFDESIKTQLETNTHFTFDSAEGSFGKPVVCQCNCLDLILRTGVEYAVNEVRQEVSLNGIATSQEEPEPATEKIQKKSKLWGAGPKVGLDFAYLFGCGFSLAGKTEAAVLVSRVEASRRDQTTRLTEGSPANFIVNRDAVSDKIWRLVPEARLRLGLAYDVCFCDIVFSGEIGYETLSYIRALPIFSDRSSVLTITDYSNIDMHGLYVNFALKY